MFTFAFLGPLPPLVSWQPRHIHLALSEEEGGLTVTWSTLNSTQESQVIVETKLGERQYNGTSELFQDGGKEQRRQWMHRVKVCSVQMCVVQCAVCRCAVFSV